MRSVAVSARKSCWVRERVELELEAVGVAVGAAMLVVLVVVDAFLPDGAAGAAREVEAKMAAAMRAVKCILKY